MFYNVLMKQIMDKMFGTAVKKLQDNKLTHLYLETAIGLARTSEILHEVATAKGVSQKLRQLRIEMNNNRLFRIDYIGRLSGKITDFDEDFYAKLSHTYFCGLPISMTIKYFAPNASSEEGKCFERSLLMFLCFDNALLVRGDNKNIEIAHGKGLGRHGWIEIGDDVYDPTHLMKFQKDYYYEMIKATNVEKMTYEEFIQQDKELKDLCGDIKATTIADFQPNGRRRNQLLNLIPGIKANPVYNDNPEFQKELAEYLQLVQYPTQEQTVDCALQK